MNQVVLNFASREDEERFVAYWEECVRRQGQCSGPKESIARTAIARSDCLRGRIVIDPNQNALKGILIRCRDKFIELRDSHYLNSASAATKAFIQHRLDEIDKGLKLFE